MPVDKYYDKYMKYKNKYLSIKNGFQIGGAYAPGIYRWTYITNRLNPATGQNYVKQFSVPENNAINTFYNNNRGNGTFDLNSMNTFNNSPQYYKLVFNSQGSDQIMLYNSAIDRQNNNNPTTYNLDKVFVYKLPYVEIKLASPSQYIAGEGRSKLLDTGSELYQIIDDIHNQIKNGGHTVSKRMDFHTELASDKNLQQPQIGQIVHSRTSQVHGRYVNVTNINNWTLTGSAFVLGLPQINDGINPVRPHITVAYITSNVPSLQTLYGYVNSVLQNRGYGQLQ